MLELYGLSVLYMGMRVDSGNVSFCSDRFECGLVIAWCTGLVSPPCAAVCSLLYHEHIAKPLLTTCNIKAKFTVISIM